MSEEPQEASMAGIGGARGQRKDELREDREDMGWQVSQGLIGCGKRWLAPFEARRLCKVLSRGTICVLCSRRIPLTIVLKTDLAGEE